MSKQEEAARVAIDLMIECRDHQMRQQNEYILEFIREIYFFGLMDSGGDYDKYDLEATWTDEKIREIKSHLLQNNVPMNIVTRRLCEDI